MSSELQPIGVIGAGAWGTALAIHAARMGHPTTLWAREAEVAADINERHENTVFLAGHKTPDNLVATTELDRAIVDHPIVLVVVPTQHLDKVIEPVADLFDADQILVSCSKGIHTGTLETVNEVLERVMPPRMYRHLAYLSGPSFAAEVAVESPTAVTVASHDRMVARMVQHALSTKRFRCYSSNDVIGVEMGGALKNVMAIACGAADGLGFGFNARAGLITRGLAEITRLAVRKGANPLTLQGLSGMGDLVLTCTGTLSRNRTVGFRLGKGETLEEILASTRSVAEGVATSRAAWALAQQLEVDAPIIENAFRVLYEGLGPLEALENLMSRPLKDELRLGDGGYG
jgi:glycerol-3-phosphate dehydrogenase (NAD(P)+)